MKFYVTTPIYYSNAKPHIGSAYPTVAADVVARHYKHKGDDVFFLTGVAEHGQKISKYAAEAGQEPQAFVDTTVQYFIEAWKTLGIEYSDFIRTTEPRHEAAVKRFFEKLKDSGKIYEAEYEGLYCIGHESFIKESELDAGGLCPNHKTKPEPVKETNWFFKLSEYQQTLRDLITSGKLSIEPESRRNEVLSFIDQGLEDIAISRQNVKWAIPLPWDESQTIYVWLDELFNYCSAIGYGQGVRHPDDKVSDPFNYWWPVDVHIVGKDIIKFHCIIWPALLLAIGEQPPKKVFAHGFFTVNGEKISKSLGNAIDPVELAKEYGADAIRYYLLRDIPFGNDGDFSHERLKDRYNADLANGLGNLVSRTLNMIEKYAAGKVSGNTPGVLRSDSPGVEEGASLQERVAQYLESLAFDKALAIIWEEIKKADELIEAKKPWELAKRAGKTPGVDGETPGVKEAREELENTLAHLYSSLVTINAALAPFLPETHAKLTALLEAQPIKKPAEPLFQRKT